MVAKPRKHSCTECDPWLSQGDIFANTFVLDYPNFGDDRVLPQLRNGPAMLVTHDCDLDKTTGRGVSKIERLAFVRLRDVESLPTDRAQLIRSSYGKLEPYEAQYLGEIPGIGESYVMVSDPYFVPARNFKYEIREYTDHEPPNRHFTLTEGDSRRFKLSETEIALYRAKWTAHWTRQVPSEFAARGAD